ncbi:hypothetical protein O6H91_04G017300 [Diphasiastrum complanatum]|uniref:Uncharacterized protein n=1 Tax=Diphasiastrum complanatum TaxID=34168 RepID=A0ACC2DUP5_DIPCM|nr:hypothetical protein O6H91_04G017300 [Diphasiastrum complanatum]
MAPATRFLLVVGGSLLLLCTLIRADYGLATFYNSYIPSACYGYDSNQFPPGNMFGAASDQLWDGGNACGKEYEVSCTGGTNNGVAQPCTNAGSIRIKIVDQCPASSCHGTIDLSADAFAAIANPIEGIIQIEYNEA